jgi:hypothetical protein
MMVGWGGGWKEKEGGRGQLQHVLSSSEYVDE